MLKAYDIENRKIILETKLDDFLDLQIDIEEPKKKFLVLTRNLIQVFNYDDNLERMEIFQTEMDFIVRPLYVQFRNNYLSYGVHKEALEMRIWRIDDVDKTITTYLNISTFEEFAKLNTPRSNIHTIAYYEEKFFVHSCVDEEDNTQGSFQIFYQMYLHIFILKLIEKAL